MLQAFCDTVTPKSAPNPLDIYPLLLPPFSLFHKIYINTPISPPQGVEDLYHLPVTNTLYQLQGIAFNCDSPVTRIFQVWMKQLRDIRSACDTQIILPVTACHTFISRDGAKEKRRTNWHFGSIKERRA